MSKRRRLIPVALVVLLLTLVVVSTTWAAVGVDSSGLRTAVTVGAVRAHQQALQDIADANGGERVAGTSGHDESAEYVYNLLDEAGYNVSYQPFEFFLFQELTPAVLEQTAPGSVAYTYGVDFFTMDYSGSGNVTAPLQAVDLVLPPGSAANTSNSGCEMSDFATFTPGNIALIQRGTCTFRLKALNAEAAGAVGVIIFNEGQPGRQDLFGGTLGGPGVNIPVVSASFAFGTALNDLIPSGLVLHMMTSTAIETRTTNNVIAETPGGRTDRVVVVGAHLDSVPGGPGINDNGSGSAAILEVALQMAELGVEPRNQVRFIWFSAEEEGLLGSEYYVSQLSTRQIRDIAVMLNFDMIGSPNAARFVYDGDGDGTGTAGPNGSDVVEDVFNNYFASVGLPTSPTAFDGRSDYGPFIEVGIPAGGLFTGAEDLKTVEEAQIYGGTAGIAFDVCYHLDCDDFSNVNLLYLDQMADAVAHAVLTFAMTTSSVNGTDQGQGHANGHVLEYLGNLLQQ
jgi:Zn-dependent M28 family amino/carboxypeptidase